MTVYQHDYLTCPWCGGESGCRIDHLYDGHHEMSWGPWHCKMCRKAFRGTAGVGRNVKVWRHEEPGKTYVTSLTLMKRDTTDGPLFFIAKSIRLSISNDTEEETQSHEVYFFEEHSCPTNWLRDIVAVIEDGDCDPHGIFDVIRSIHIPDDFSTDDDSQWPLLFPEALGGTIIDAAVSPEMKLLAGEGEPPTEKSQSTPDGANGR